jgi:hypothetical protein
MSSVVGAPTRFLQGQHPTDTRSLALDVFGGEVLTAFDLATVTLDKVQTRTLSGGARSARFPKTWKATAGYHTAGQEMLGDPIATGEITISVDDILVSHVSIYDLDEMLTHFEVRSQFSAELGRGLGRVYDKNNFRQLVLAARAAAAGPFPGGTVIASDTLKATAGVFDGAAWIAQIRAANLALFRGYAKRVRQTRRRWSRAGPKWGGPRTWRPSPRPGRGPPSYPSRLFAHPLTPAAPSRSAPVPPRPMCDNVLYRTLRLAPARPPRVGSGPGGHHPMPDDTTVPVTIEVEPAAAAALGDEARRARVGRLVSRMLRPASVERLFEVMDAIAAEAERRGLTDEVLEEELAAYNAERRERPPAA